MTPQDINALLKVRSENENLEFKTAERNFEFEVLVKYCVALANEGGGRIVLGVSDKKPRKVTGTAAFAEPERTVAGVYDRLHIKVQWDEVMHPQGRVLVFTVPSRPLGQPIGFNGTFFMRVGEQLLPMSADHLRSIYAEGNPDWALQTARKGCTGQEVISLLNSQKYFDLVQLAYPATRDAVLNRLQKEKLIAQQDGKWDILNLGAVLFAKDLRDFDLLSRKAIRVIAYEGKGKQSPSRLDQTLYEGYAVCFESLILLINSILPSAEIIREVRKTVKMYPPITIRELVANACIHQNFAMPGGSVMIELYEDRLEISNPGTPSILPDRFIDEYQSRNERLADIMRRMGFCEEKGSGIDKVISAIEEYQLPAPDFRVKESRTYAVLFAQLSLDKMDQTARIRACYQHACLRYVMNEKMTNLSLRERFNVSSAKSATISQIIQATLKQKKIRIANPEQKSPRYRSYSPFWA